MKSEGRPCLRCGCNSRILDKRERREFTYRLHQCRVCGFTWPGREFHGDESPQPIVSRIQPDT